MEYTRRQFIKTWAVGLLHCAVFSSPFWSIPGGAAERERLKGAWGFVGKKLSPYFATRDGGMVECLLCPRHCIVAPGERGYCDVRANQDGKLYSLVYGNPCAVHIDPIEKKPFFHVLPGTSSFSIATAGCNFDCKFCQNWEISQEVPEKTFNFHLPPSLVVESAVTYECLSIASTYVEPTIFFEYMYDISLLARQKGILNVFHSNGYINAKPLDDLCRCLDAACIDLKGFSEEFYQNMTEGSLQPVLRTIQTLKDRGVHVELVNLLIPTKNDDEKMIRDMCSWIASEVGPDVPLHFSRFYPMYKLRTLPPTPVETLERARNMALASGLRYVYIGNVAGHEAEHTYCPRCKKVVVARRGYFVVANHLVGGTCGFCGHSIPGIWSRPRV